MSDTLVNIKGLSDLQKFLDQLPAKIEQNVMRGSLRAGMNVVKPVAEAKIHKVSGLLAAGLKVGSRAKDGVVTAYLKVSGPHAGIAHLVEYGTKPHVIEMVNRVLYFNGHFAKSIQHPGSHKFPFLRPALDGQAQAAVVAAAQYMKKRLATKEGLDTADVKLEGDE